MPPKIQDSDDDSDYFDKEKSAVSVGERKGRRSRLSRRAKEESEEPSEMTEENEEGREDGEEEEDEDEEEEEDEEEDEEEEDEAASSDAGDVKTHGDEDDEIEEEEEEEVPSVSDEEDNYKLEDPDEIDEDLDLKDEDDEYEEKEVLPTSRRAANMRSKPSASARPNEFPNRSNRKRQLPLYNDEDVELDESTRDKGSSRKSKRAEISRNQPEGIDEDLILTDEEQEYNPNVNPDPSKMTERQRARFLEESGESSSFESLDKIKTATPKGKSKTNETEEQAALRKAENARRRHDQKVKQLEEEKKDTLDRLLKRRVTKGKDSDDKEGTAESSGQPLKPRRPMTDHPALFRYISSTKLDGNSVLGYPGPSVESKPVK